MVYPREYVSYDTVKKLFGKKLLLFGPLEIIDDKLERTFSKYDYILLSCKTLEHIYNFLGENIKKYNFIWIMNGTYPAQEENHDNIVNLLKYVDIFILSSIERISKHRCLNSIDSNNCFFYHPNAYLQNLQDGNQLPLVLAWFLRNKIEFKEFKLSGFTFHMDTYDYLVKVNSTKEEIDKIYKLRSELSETNCPVLFKYKHYNNKLGESHFEKFKYYINERQTVGVHPLALQYNFFIKFLSYYINNTKYGIIKLDSKLKNIIKKYLVFFSLSIFYKDNIKKVVEKF